jgi:hypothetical protein
MSRRGARRSRAQRALSVLLFVAAVAPASSARADGAAVEERAKDAYDRGSVAYRGGDYARAASEFAMADALAPNDVTLRAALDAATLADDAILGTELLERAARDPLAPPELAAVVATARARFAHRTGRILVLCPGGSCLATVDGAAVSASRPRIVTPGVHTVALQTTGAAEPRLVDVPPDQTVEVAPLPFPALAPSPTPPPATTGISPVWFVTAAVATGVALGFTVWSGVDTVNAHASFDDAGCRGTGGPTCASLRSSGLAAEERTNTLIIGTAVLAVATTAIGLFATRWHGRAIASVGLYVRSGYVSIGSSF